jgi:microcin C transport system permease protein
VDTRIEDKPVIRVGDPVEPDAAQPTKEIGRSPLPKRGYLGGLSLSPLNRRRWRNFKANRRGYWSLWLFLALFVVSLFAEFIANDKPIIAYYKGELLFPALVDYPESKFGGFLRSPTTRTR